MNNIPEVFISYCWSPPPNKIRVKKLANKLFDEKISVIYDDENLLPGHDKNKFMEQIVKNPAVRTVLVICNKEYLERSEDRKGGVGVEYDMIINAINKNPNTTKFIPVLFEKIDGEPCLPTRLESFAAIDFSNGNFDEAEYQKLLRAIAENNKEFLSEINTVSKKENPIVQEHIENELTSDFTSFSKWLYKDEKDRNNYLSLNSFSNSFDSLLFIKELLLQNNKKIMTWKWIIISSYHSLYMFCIDALHFSNPDDVTHTGNEDSIHYVKRGDNEHLKMRIVRYNGLQHAYKIVWDKISEEEYNRDVEELFNTHDTKQNRKNNRKLISFWTALARVQDKEIFGGRYMASKVISISQEEMQELEYLYFYHQEIMEFIPMTSIITVAEIKTWTVVTLKIIRRLLTESNLIDFYFQDVDANDVSKIIDEILLELK